MWAEKESLRKTDAASSRAVIASAARRFGHFGVKKTTMDEIAADAGISKGSVYLLFENKEELLYQVILHTVSSRLVEWEKMAEKKRNALVLVRELGEWWVEGAVQKRAAFLKGETMEGHLSREARERLHAFALPRMEDVIGSVFERGMREGVLRPDADRPLLARLAVDQLAYAIHITALEPGFDWAASWGRFCDCLSQGFSRRKDRGEK